MNLTRRGFLAGGLAAAWLALAAPWPRHARLPRQPPGRVLDERVVAQPARWAG